MHASQVVFVRPEFFCFRRNTEEALMVQLYVYLQSIIVDILSELLHGMRKINIPRVGYMKIRY